MYKMRTSEIQTKEQTNKPENHFLVQFLEKNSSGTQHKHIDEKMQIHFLQTGKMKQKKLLFALRDQEKQGKEMI